MLGDLSIMEEKLESGKILLAQHYNLLHIDLACALNKVEAGLKVSTQGSSAKTVMSVSPKATSSVVRVVVSVVMMTSCEQAEGNLF